MHTNRGCSLSCANTYGLQLQPLNATKKADFLQRIEQAVDGGAPRVRTLNAHKPHAFSALNGKAARVSKTSSASFVGVTRKPHAWSSCNHSVGWTAVDDTPKHLNDTKSHLRAVLIPRLICDRNRKLGNCNSAAWVIAKYCVWNSKPSDRPLDGEGGAW